MNKRAILLSAVLLALLSVLSYAQAPVPFINLPLVPDATPPGGTDFTLTVNGTGFVSNSVVNWNGSALATQFVSSSQLTATVPAADIATASTAWVTVVNPAPAGGTSNTAYFTVTLNSGNSVVFNSPLFFSVGTFPTSVAVADFNGDRRLDLAVTDMPAGSVSILLGDGKGNFASASPLSSPWPNSVVVGDFNADGKADLAVASFYGGVFIYLGDGTGNFTSVFSSGAGGLRAKVAVGDVNGDGNLDIVVVSGDYGQPNTVSVLLGDGTGNFVTVSSFSTGNGYASVALGDFDSNGKLDLAVTSCDDGTVSILLGDGSGRFTLALAFPTGKPFSYSVAIGDFNVDARLDLAITSPGVPTSNVASLLGDGMGNFTLAWFQDVGVDGPCPVVIGDFNGDGKLDMASPLRNNFSGDTVGVWLGDGTGNFTLAAQPAAPRPGAVALGDFNGDGRMDIAVADPDDNKVSILLGVPPFPVISLSPTNLAFGTQLFGTTSVPQPVTLTNSGNATLEISSIAASANFVQKNDCGPTLAAGAHCTITVAFRPHNVDTLHGTITITDNAPDSPQTVSLTGVGTAVALLPSNLDFGNQPVGTTSQPKTVTLTNHGPRALSISGAWIQGNNAGAFAQTNTCEPKLPAGGSCSLSVTFTPKFKGTKTATGYVEDNGGASPQTVSLSGNGT